MCPPSAPWRHQCSSATARPTSCASATGFNAEQETKELGASRSRVRANLDLPGGSLPRPLLERMQDVDAFFIQRKAKSYPEVRWPSGTVQRLANVAADHVLTVREGE